MRGFLARIGFALADSLHKALDPYDEFTRPFVLPSGNTALFLKARTLLAQLHERFYQENGLYLYNLYFGDEEPDYGDQAVHQGLTTTAVSLLDLLGISDQVTVNMAVRGQALLYQNGKLIRGRDPRDVLKFADNASNDSACGQLCGSYFAYRYGNSEYTAANIRNLADELIANDYSLVNQDGSPTTYGKLINGAFTDPQRSSLALAIFRAAGQITKNPIYFNHFWKLYEKYGDLLPFAEFKFLDFTHSFEVHRCAIQLHILADLTEQFENEVAAKCRKGLERIWDLNRKARDPWIAALVHQFSPLSAAELEDVVNRLREYPPEGKPPCRETVNSRYFDYWNEQGVRFIKVKGEIRSSQPLPYHMLPPQDFWPQRHPFMSDAFQGVKDGKVRHNAVDFLAPYGLLRIQGVIGTDD